MGLRQLAWALALAFVATPAAAIDVFPLDQVRAGLRGEGMTVLSGDEMTRFGVEVLGVMPSFIGPGQDLILVRLDGDKIEYTGVVSGMSGSPVYVNGKLLGAVAYRLGAFSKEPIAGITPAAEMLRGTGGSPGRASADSYLERAAYERVVPIETPVMVSGAPPGLLAAFETRLRAQGLTLVRAAAGKRSKKRTVARSRPGRFVPGGPIAGLLVDGDLSLAAIGTVTHVEGSRVVGFGHSFLGRGRCQIPMAEAEVVATLASIAGSSKLGNATRVVGTITDDRSVAIAGDIGPAPATVSLEVEIDAAAETARRDLRHRLSYRLFEDPQLTPLLVEIAVGSALGGRIGFESGGSARLRAQLSLPGGRELTLEDRLSVPDGGSIAALSAAWLAGRVAPLWGNRYSPISGLRVKLHVELEAAPRSATVVSARVSPPAARPGDDITVHVELMDYRDRRRSLVRTLKLPRGLEAGAVKLHVGGRAHFAGVDRNAGRLPTPASLDDEIENLSRLRRADRLYLALVRAAPGLSVRGRALPALPPSMRSILGRAAGGSERQGLTRRVELEQAIDIGAQVDQGVTLGFDVLPRETPQ